MVQRISLFLFPDSPAGAAVGAWLTAGPGVCMAVPFFPPEGAAVDVSAFFCFFFPPVLSVLLPALDAFGVGVAVSLASLAVFFFLSFFSLSGEAED